MIKIINFGSQRNIQGENNLEIIIWIMVLRIKVLYKYWFFIFREGVGMGIVLIFFILKGLYIIEVLM